MFQSQVNRVFPAPRERVFRALTNPEDLARWWGPNATAEVDLRVGGTFRLGMDLMGGERLVSFGTYREIQAPERLVYSWAWESEPTAVTLVTVELRDRGAETEVLLTHAENTSEEQAENHRQGWNYCLDRLVKLVEA